MIDGQTRGFQDETKYNYLVNRRYTQTITEKNRSLCDMHNELLVTLRG